MALVPTNTNYATRFNTATLAMHVVSIDGVGTETDLGEITNSIDTAQVDGMTTAQVGITYDHHEVHSGSSFTCQVGQLVSDTNDRTALSVLTPAGTKLGHMVASGTASTAAWFYIREGPTITDNEGATQAICNRNRSSETASIMIDTSQNPDLVGSATYFAEADQADYTENGTLIYAELLASGVRQSSGGGGSRGTSEFILKASTKYLFYVKSLTADDNYHNVILDWYEHTSAA